jgi:hypothetical protein
MKMKAALCYELGKPLVVEGGYRASPDTRQRVMW